MVEINEASLRRLVVIARRAGVEILRWYGGAGAVEIKGDGSPLTAADRAANDIVTGELRDWSPRVPVVSEEDPIPPIEERERWQSFWLVDPLDGTKEFLSGNGEFTVNIALIAHGAPVLGVVFAPALGRCWYGGAGLGSWVEESSGSPTRIYSSPPAPGRPLVIVESRSHPSDRLSKNRFAAHRFQSKDAKKTTARQRATNHRATNWSSKADSQNRTFFVQKRARGSSIPS